MSTDQVARPTRRTDPPWRGHPLFLVPVLVAVIVVPVMTAVVVELGRGDGFEVWLYFLAGYVALFVFATVTALFAGGSPSSEPGEEPS